MAGDNNIKNFAASDIEKYHKGLLSSTDRHALEKAALDDPFLADALEGYATIPVNVSADIAELKNRLAAKTESGKVIPMNTGGGSAFPWLRVAVMIVVIAGAGFLSYQFLFKNKSDNQIAKSPWTKNEQAKVTDSITNKSAPETDNADTTIIPSIVSNGSASGNSSATVSSDDNAAGERKDIVKDIKSRKQVLLDSVRENLALDITSPAANNISKTEADKKTDDYKTLSKDAAPQKGDIAVNENNKSRDAATKKVSEKDADGVADNLEKEAKLNEVVVTGYGTQKNEAAFYKAKQEPYRSPNIFRGTVTDANNNALPFANITNTRDNVGTYSDGKGNFTLVSTDSVMNVQVRSVGFENNNIQLRNNVAQTQVRMQEDRSIAVNVLDSSKRNSNRSRNPMTFEEPEPVDGWISYDSYLANNLNMPEKIDKKKTGGADAVEISFEVNKYGEPINIKIEKSLCDKCDKEAIRLIKNGPKWKRKAKKGRTTVTVTFNQ